MIAFIKLSEGKLKRVTSFILAAVVCVFLTLPAKADAGIWDDSDGGNIDTVIARVKSIKDNVDDLIKTVKAGKDTITDGKIKAMIADMRVMLQEAVNAQQDGVNDFLMGGNCVANDGTPCGFFRADLLFFLQTLEDINNQLLSMHNIPSLNLQVEDPGLANLLNKIPGRILFPIYKVMTKTKLLDAGFLAALADINTHLSNVKLVLFPDPSASPTSLSTLTAATGMSVAVTVPNASNSCLFIDEHPLAFTIATGYLTGVGIINRIIGAILEAMGETFIGGPAEVDGGIHGYVHGTIKTSTLGTMGKIASGIGGVMQALGSAISSKITFCGIELRQVAIIRGQKEILCAMKNNNLSPQCDEFVGNGFDNQGIGGQGGGQGGGGQP